MEGGWGGGAKRQLAAKLTIWSKKEIELVVKRQFPGALKMIGKILLRIWVSYEVGLVMLLGMLSVRYVYFDLVYFASRDLGPNT